METMARARRGKTPPLIQLLQREPYRFDSSQVVRILEARKQALRTAEIRFRSSLSLTFPVSDVESVVVPAELRQSPVVTVSFLGLGGAMGPLPTPYTEHLNNAVRRREPAGRDFLDLFNHRLVTAATDLAKLFRPTLQAPIPHESAHARYLYALLGLRTPGIVEAIPGLAPTLLPLTALLNARPLSAHAIERMLRAYFGVSARVIPFRGGWFDVPPDQRSAIGVTGRNRALGSNAMLGGRQWDQSAGITVEIGPLPIAEAERFLPAGAPHARLTELLDFVLGGEVEVAVRLLVDTRTVRSSHLARAGTMRLGWTSWLHRTGSPGRINRPTLGRSARLGGRADAESARRLAGNSLPALRVIALRPALNVFRPAPLP
ncbi:type VI secretion system baseplate subunit TssG [Sphingomonas sp. DG1-23]|uniref:type VI secretion system baseplate subunit TssG n=1 Tax=Sphingomonas sp. DG1-23 TaxID=3068316 RepID=UPI00273E1ABA|nr:type VI secretion system baseplate subunit TssG [Sphingomonas sp. DG1-23]MDP5280608.1 type VI secretion system baseplate subunit TssG [Sphingomonas sp. DG1-23]